MQTVLLDRDGTVIVEPPDGRVDSIEKIRLFPDTLEALKYLADNGFNAIFITNQAGIAEGRITGQEFEMINQRVIQMLAPSGITILKTYSSPYDVQATNKWSKPAPGMLLQAANDFHLDLSKMYMVGDRRSDILAGINAGTKTILVKTANTPVDAPEATYTAPNLLAAARYVVEH